MRNWRFLVEKEMKDFRIASGQREQVIAELAEHLEDLYLDALTNGLDEDRAIQLCRAQIESERTLAQRIEQATEGPMNYRTRTLWLPGLATLATAAILLLLLQHVSFIQPKVLRVGEEALGFDFRWLVLLPIGGAVGAYLSKRAGGRLSNSLMAALFPVIVMLGSFCIFLAIALLEGNGFIRGHVWYLGLSLIDWTLVPSVPLLLGALLACRKEELQNPE
jgi:hypothetical protein